MHPILKAIQEFFLTEGSAGGLIGAFLVLAASYFTDVRLPVKDKSWLLKILFLFAGALAGALIHHSKGVDILYCAMIGAGWPYLAISLKRGVETFMKGRALQQLGDEAFKELMEMARERARS